MSKFKFFFAGKIPSKANYKKISYRRINGYLKPFIINNPQVGSTQKAAIYQLSQQKRSYKNANFPITEPVKVSYTFLLSERLRQRDIDNMEKFIGDALEKAGIIKKDSLIYMKEKVEKRLGTKELEAAIITIEIIDKNTLDEINKRCAIEDTAFEHFLKSIRV